MDVVVTTSEVHEVSAEEVATALIEAGWYVHSVTVVDRRGVLSPDEWRDGN